MDYMKNVPDKFFDIAIVDPPYGINENHLCEKYYTIEDDGLSKSWKGERVYMNPPYGTEISKWVKKAKEETEQGECLVVGLLPSRTDTAWWHDYVEGHADVLFLRGRLKFGDGKNSAPFPSAIVLWWGKEGLRNR